MLKYNWLFLGNFELMMGGILMRKIFSVITGIIVCFWGSIGSILALGEDKI